LPTGQSDFKDQTKDRLAPKAKAKASISKAKAKALNSKAKAKD